MKTALSVFALGATLAVSSFSIHAQESFIGLTGGETSNTLHRSSAIKADPATRRVDRTINGSSNWGVRGGQQTDNGRFYLSYEHVSDTYARTYKLRQQNLLGSYDAFLPVGNTTKLFGGGTAGLVKLDQDSRGFRSDSDVGLAAGFQFGVLQQLGSQASVEAGYRYMRTTADARLKARDDSIRGSVDLRSSKQAHIGLNFHF